ncbi:MBL fold metallo-hydrolase [Acidisoma cladoniae]|jgi:cyclase|uniref:MBL fold metallo-hydrolase n=1 Tax=Acidisoma cladoniae TaxID=3040935 RepID=UPI002551A9BE|nr:MBL fold metallo-hydrolase [Acidisoma sp. PAMC 29798]
MSAHHPARHGETMRIFSPAPHVLAFYDGRVAGDTLPAESPTWLDWAYGLGTSSFAIVDGDEALVYDTHMSITHATLVRRHLEGMGVTRMRVVMSHWHTDHVAGNAAFADCAIIAHALTARALEDNRAALEEGEPPIFPIIMPTQLYEDRLSLTVGQIAVELRHVDCHSHDGTVLFMPETGLLLAGDTLEDTVTYVAEPERLAEHLDGLRLMASWPISAILLNHGDPTVMAQGGYPPALIAATARYIERLQRCRTEPALAALSLSEFVAEDLAAGTLTYIDAYEPVHRNNVALVIAEAAS